MGDGRSDDGLLSELADVVDDKVAAVVDGRVAAVVDDEVAAVVDDKVAATVDGKVDEAVGSAVEDAREAATGAQASASAASASAMEAEQARLGARAAGEAAIDAATAVAPDDPLLDTAIRKIEAGADEAHPYGTLGRPLSRRSPFWLAFNAALGIALAYGLVQAVVAVRGVLVLLLVSAFLAIGLDPAVQFFCRRGVVRGRAVAIVLLGVVLFFVGFGMAVVPPIVDQGQQFVDAVPDYLRDLQSNERIASLDERYGLLERAEAFVAQPEQIGGALFGGVVGVGRVVFSAFFNALTVLILTLYFLSSLPTIKASAYRLVPRSRRARVGLLTDEVLARVGGYVAGALTIGALAGVTSFVLLSVLGVPYPVALSLVIALTALVPLIGATIGATIATLVAFSVSLQAGVICAVFYLAYQQLENYLLYPKIMKRSVDVSPAATVVAVLVGGSLLGVVGALLAIPMAAAVQLLLQQVVTPRQDAA